PYTGRAVGVDLSTAMLNVARAGIDAASLRNVQLRQGDLYALPVEPNSYDLIILHQVLHYLDDPARALREAARALAPGGRLLVIDFAPHALEFLREQHEHRRLGFAADEISAMLRECNLNVESQRDLAAPGPGGNKLTVSIWIARDPRVISDFLPRGDVELA
ncbi:MAG: methyltransferase domain-containing protein, partial [Alphaproteobacteria bacterium]|nr:methyltransferase domain-containing protein [Alphaproteobacteria bacterium]